MDDPGAAWGGDAGLFSRYLNDTGQPFLLLDQAGGQQAHIRFTGPWQGREVVWDCTFVTLACEQAQVASGVSPAVGCFIDIGPPGDNGIPLRVCLDLPGIDLPAIRKMIVMIRNYRRLRSGRHDFGVNRFSPAP
ncbi:MAG TPA: hypothetical protein ENJ80_03725 [Gammaproteobacteria bacterium]|nr:hypothetical protein [Gammaproteobacteria bacterium]